MIRITNGSQVLLVTKGAFKGIFAPAGWVEASENDDFKDEKAVDETPEPSEEVIGVEAESDDAGQDTEVVEEADDDDDLSEKPLSQMTVKELRDYAAENDLDITGLSTKEELRNAIKEQMN